MMRRATRAWVRRLLPLAVLVFALVGLPLLIGEARDAGQAIGGAIRALTIKSGGAAPVSIAT